jgi:hypothetical protein
LISIYWQATKELRLAGRQSIGLGLPLPQAKMETFMSASNEYLAIFLGSKNSPRRAAWDALPEGERHARSQEGIAAWKAWMQRNAAAVTTAGGPLGNTKKVSPAGTEDIHNLMSGFVIVRAPSHEAAARLFEDHPQFTIFPGDSVEIMPVLPVPGG